MKGKFVLLLWPFNIKSLWVQLHVQPMSLWLGLHEGEVCVIMAPREALCSPVWRKYCKVMLYDVMLCKHFDLVKLLNNKNKIKLYIYI